jgi:UDP-3-O-[3-hydroxymyristoyl] N-acetylglucosamine deacetylase
LSGRQTVAAATERLYGVGLHTGSPCWIQLAPAEFPGAGIIFRNYSTCGEVTAAYHSVVSTNRSTCLASDATRVDTVEHLLSALYGCNITDAVVLFDGTELPIGDGSSLPFIELIESVGAEPVSGLIEDLTLEKEVAITDGNGSVMTAVPSDSFWAAITIDYSSCPSIGVQSAIYRGENYRSEVGQARTYGFFHELDALRSAGLAKGASLENVVALDNLGNADPQTPLRMQDELVRHKLLDIIGDLSLLQRRLRVGIVALKPSHNMNARMTGELLRMGGN